MNGEIQEALNGVVARFGCAPTKPGITTFCGKRNDVVTCGWTEDANLFIVGIWEESLHFIVIDPSYITRVEQTKNEYKFFGGHINPMYTFSFDE